MVDGEVAVNESLLTGETDEIFKKPGDTLMSGSFVVSGECCARLEKVGADSYISQLTLEAKAMNRKEQSEMIRVLDKLVGVVGILIIPLGLLLFGQQFFVSKASFSSSIVSMVAAVIGMIPEGLYLLASVALAISVIRLSSQKVLVHDMKCIETLARVDVLCVDKTGTITENNMQVISTIPMEGYNPSTGSGLKTMISDLVVSMPDGNITMQALKRFFKTPSDKKADVVIPFSSTYKYCGAAFSGDAYVLGAPEFVLREDYEKFKVLIENYSSDGYRVLVFGRYSGVPDGKELTEAVTPLGLILLANPIRKDAPETFRYFAEQGVAIKVISGDNPVTVSQVALEAGIADAAKYIDMSTLHTMKSLDGVNKKNDVNNTASEAPEKNVKTESEKIDFSKVKVEPLFEEFVDFDTFSKSDFRAVKVKECVAVPKSKKLLQFTLDDGTGTDRTILSGIHAYYEPEELVGKTLIAITNLPPRAMMGIESCGMLLSAIHEEEGEEKLHLLMVDNHIPAGAKLY